jgi:hypothetical protein
MNTGLIKNVAILIALICFMIPIAHGEKPDWVKVHPVSEQYYAGIGVAQKSPGSKDYMQKARDAALNDLASQTGINLTGAVWQTIIEQAGVDEDVYKRYLQTSAKTELEGFELANTWEDESEYWVYYKLAREPYEHKRQARVDEATNLALVQFSKARKSEQDYDIAKALRFYMQALPPIENYLALPLKVNYKDSEINLAGEIYTSLQSLLTQINLQPSRHKIQAKAGQPLPAPVEIKANFISLEEIKPPIAGLPLKFSFAKGDGKLATRAITDEDGVARSQVTRIKSTEEVQIIKAELDIEKFFDLAKASPIMLGISRSLTIPTATVVLDVFSITAYVTSREVHFGGPLGSAAIEPALKKSLAQFGFSFTGIKRNADYAISIEAESRKGAEITDGMYSAYVNLTVTAFDNVQNVEFYKKSLHDIKGIDQTYDKAGRKAFENAGQKVNEELIPDLIQAIQQ